MGRETSTKFGGWGGYRVVFEYEPKIAPLALMRGEPSGVTDGPSPTDFPPGSESSPWLIVLDWGHMCVPRWRF